MVTDSAIARPAVRILLGSASSIGPGKARLLEAVSRCGSISAAAREMGMSYRRAWLLIDSMNKACTRTLVETAAGGQRGGGARLTAFGSEVLQRYRKMEERAAECLRQDLSEFAKFLQQAETSE